MDKEYYDKYGGSVEVGSRSKGLYICTSRLELWHLPLLEQSEKLSTLMLGHYSKKRVPIYHK